jgi:hypothetical protein
VIGERMTAASGPSLAGRLRSGFAASPKEWEWAEADGLELDWDASIALGLKATVSGLQVR